MKIKIITALTIILIVLCTNMVYATETLEIADNTVSEFSLTVGKSEDNSKGMEVTGALYLPKEVKYSEVYIFIHGRSRPNNMAHHGFDYVIEELNNQGYRAISINICSIYKKASTIEDSTESDLVIEAVKNIVSPNENTIDSVEFGNIREIVLVGHSRAGYHVFKVGNSLVNSSIRIKHIISIAPYMMDWNLDNTTPDINTTIIVPEYDGDIDKLDGGKLFEMEKLYNKRRTIRYIYLLGANHNYFSTEMKIDDTEEFGLKADFRITREEQMEFLKNTVLKYTTTEENYQNTIINQKYILRQHSRSYREIEIDSIPLSGENVEVSDITIQADKLNSVSKSWFREPALDTASYSLIEFEENGKLVLDVPNLTIEELIIEAALDTTKTEINKPKLNITLQYLDGSTESQEISPLDIRGKLLEINDICRWSRGTPIESWEINIDSTKPIDKLIIYSSSCTQYVLKNMYYA